MKLPHSRFIIALGLVMVLSVFPMLSLSAQTTCSAPLPTPPHQGGGKSASTIFGVQADISYSNPNFACRNRIDSYTNEWIMIVGPGSSAWIQLGWERSHNHEPLHFWYQAIGPNGFFRDLPFDPVQFPVTHITTFRIEVLSDPDPNIGTHWLLWADNTLLDTLPAVNLGWPSGGQYAIDAQWSGEVSYAESDMGGPYTSPVYIGFPMWSLGGSWNDITAPYIFNSYHPRYAGDARLYPDGTWVFRNWSWYRSFFPMISK